MHWTQTAPSHHPPNVTRVSNQTQPIKSLKAQPLLTGRSNARVMLFSPMATRHKILVSHRQSKEVHTSLKSYHSAAQASQQDMSCFSCAIRPTKSASRIVVDFGVLNDNLINGLILCVKCISRFLMKVQMNSLIHLLKYNYEANRTM
jgi:hypothetical protein